jgi:hypothetical protein
MALREALQRLHRSRSVLSTVNAFSRLCSHSASGCNSLGLPSNGLSVRTVRSKTAQPGHLYASQNLADLELANMARPPHPANRPSATQRIVASATQQAVIQPWGIRVQRSQCCFGPDQALAWGPWTAASDSLFTPFAEVHAQADERDSVTSAAEAHRVHHGLVERLVDVERIVEISDPRLAAFSGAQAVRFDATALLSREGTAPCLGWGGWQERGREAIACEDVWGVLLGSALLGDTKTSTPAQARQVAFKLAQLLDKMDCSLACGNVACLIDAGSTGLWWRASQIQAATLLAPDASAHLVLALAGSPLLPNAGAWRVTREFEVEQGINQAPVPVIRRSAARLWQVAECRDLFADIECEAANEARHGMPARAGHRSHPKTNASTTMPAPVKSHSTHSDFVLHTTLQSLHFLRPQLEGLAMKSSGEYGRLNLGHHARLALSDVPTAWVSRDSAATLATLASQPDVLLTQLRAVEMPSLGIDGLHFETHWKIDRKHARPLFETGSQRLQWCYDAAGHAQASVRLSSEGWQISLGPLSLELQNADRALLRLAAEHLRSGSAEAAHLAQPVWHWGRGLQAVQALWPGLIKALNSACAATDWPVVTTDTRLHIQSHTCAPHLTLGWGTLQHAQIEVGGWACTKPNPSWFGVTLGSAAQPLTLVLPTGTGCAFAQIGIGPAMNTQVQISSPVNLRSAPGNGSALDAASAEAMAVIQARADLPEHLFAQVGGMVHASVLGGLARVAVAVHATAEVRPGAHEVLLDAALNVGLCSATAALLDIDFDTEWRLGAQLARSL